MRTFSTLFVAAVFALSANAAAFEKRDISAPVALCISDIDAVSSQITVVGNLVNSFTAASGGLTGAIAIHTQEQTLETALKKAGTDCAVTPPVTVTDEEANAVLTVVQNLVPKVVSTLQGLTAKQGEFGKIPLAVTLVKGDIKNLNTQTVTLDNALLSKTPADLTDAANVLVAQINTAFADVRTAYGI